MSSSADLLGIGAALTPTNPVVDYHLVYATVLVAPWPLDPPVTYPASAACGPAFPSSAAGSGCAVQDRW
ncbi:hypothetical protein [Streptomyces sp. M92]|uniref:hypothetical protein n=1 Tax=Streptomyces sp. M92 TaxID=2944250 RepID=UPI00234BAA9A|nr:hypothetical protein [Streptomyces sp. M92]